MAGEHADSERLAYELRVVVSVGLRQSALARRAGEIEGLLALDCAQPAPGKPVNGYSRAKGLVGAMRTIIKELDDVELRRAITMLVGASDLLATISAVARREQAADLLGIGPMQSDNFLKRQEPRYRDLMADKLIDFNERFRLRQSRNQMALGFPADPAVAIDWLDRFQYYYGVWTDLSGLTNDITA